MKFQPHISRNISAGNIKVSELVEVIKLKNFHVIKWRKLFLTNASNSNKICFKQRNALTWRERSFLFVPAGFKEVLQAWQQSLYRPGKPVQNPSVIHTQCIVGRMTWGQTCLNTLAFVSYHSTGFHTYLQCSRTHFQLPYQ